MKTETISYKEVFELAKSKGCKELTAGIHIESYHAERKWDVEEYLTLCLLQKWLRDSLNVFVELRLVTPYDLKVSVIGEGLEIFHSSLKFSVEEYESALLHGINEALQLI